MAQAKKETNKIPLTLERMTEVYARMAQMNQEAKRSMQAAYNLSREHGLVYEDPKINKVKGRRPKTTDYNYAYTSNYNDGHTYSDEES